MKNTPLMSAITLLLCGTLTSCSLTAINPAPEKNYKIEMVHQSPHWEPRVQEAVRSVTLQEPILKTSDHKAIVRWRKQLDLLANKPPLEQLEGVQELVNRDVTYLPDYQHWSKNDKWGSPLETLLEGGDCEDIAILKLISLHYLGWRYNDEFFLVLIGDSLLSTPPRKHAILMVTLDDGSQLLLDSLESSIVPPSEDYHFKPQLGVSRTLTYSVKLSEK